MQNQLARHEEQIKTLFKRVDDMDSMKELIYSLDKNMALQTQLLQNVVEHNKKQDARADKQEKMMCEQQKINVKINENLTELAEGQRALNKRVGKLEERVEQNEEKHTIDIRDFEKKKYIDILYKIAVPFGIAAILILEIIKYLN